MIHHWLYHITVSKNKRAVHRGNITDPVLSYISHKGRVFLFGRWKITLRFKAIREAGTGTPPVLVNHLIFLIPERSIGSGASQIMVRLVEWAFVKCHS